MRIPVIAALDVVFVLLFVVIGRFNHNEAFSPSGFAETAWPFLLALAVAPGVVVSGFCASPLVVTGVLRHGWDSYLLWCVWLWGRTGSRRLGLRPRGPTTCGPRWF